MSKKALVARETVLWIIAAGALVFAMFAFGPKFIAQAKGPLFSFGSGVLPDQEAPTLKGEVQIPPQLELEFNALVNNINGISGTAADACLIYLTELAGFEPEWHIELAKDKATLYRVTGKSTRIDKKTATLNNFNPCIINEASAVNFYNRYFASDLKLDIPISPSTQDIILDASNRYKYLYRADGTDNNKYCTFNFYSGGCASPKNGGNDGIPDGCKSEMPKFESGLWLCEDKLLANGLPRSELAAKDAEKIADAMKKGISSSADKCLIRYDALSLDSWKIGMVKDGEKIKFVQVDGGNRVGKLDVSIDGQICLINSNNGINLGGPVSLQRMGITPLGGKYHLTVGGKYDNNVDAYFNLKDDAKFMALYKKDAGNVCFLALREDTFSGCDGSTDAGIDDDCYKSWVDGKKILTCTEKTSPLKPALVDKGYTSNFITAAIEFNDAFEQAAKSEKQICRVEMARYPGFDDQRIKIVKTGVNLHLWAEGDGKDAVPLGIINNYQPCIVHGQNFYGWLWNGDKTAEVNQHIAKTDVVIAGEGKNGVEFFPKDAENRDKRDLYKDGPLIYKTTDESGNKYMCIIQRWDEGSCKNDTSLRNAVAQRCIEKKSPDYLEMGRTPIC